MQYKMKRAKLVQALTALWESLDAADRDFCGEQRKWHLPRLQKAALLLTEVHPLEATEAISQAKSPYPREALRIAEIAWGKWRRAHTED